MKQFIARGEPQVWLTAAALTTTLLIGLTLIGVILVNGLGTFWPKRLTQLELADGAAVLGEVLKREPVLAGDAERLQLKIGNRDLYGLDFRWIDERQVVGQSRPETAVTVERLEYGNFYGYLQQVETPQQRFGSADAARAAAELAQLWPVLQNVRRQVEQLQQQLDAVTAQVTATSRTLEQLQRRQRQLDYQAVAETDPRRRQLGERMEAVREQFRQVAAEQRDRRSQLAGYVARFTDANGRPATIELAHIVRCYQPNALNLFERAGVYLSKLWELFSGEPRESNTEGGLFPAIFGTVLLIFVMSLFSFPLGVIAAIYLREYARDGLTVRLVRIAVNNLAGIPSIVYGIFGLGFFVYGVGGSIDALFFPEALPTPTFGTGGLLWASLTLALLTVPVVIVTTEEALGAIPAGIREGSLALGSTRFQTLTRILLPMASPGIMTGLILSMARAAGEVAPLMITGVVKLAPALPLDGQFPFFHLERKFMHLGFHIYDIGFQSPNVEAARPMVFVTTLLLVLIVLLMSGLAIRLRNRMKKKYTFGTF